MRVGLNLVALFGVIAQPIIPDAAAKILDAINIPEANRTWNFGESASLINALPINHPIAPPELLFAKIEDTDIDDWSVRFGGDST